MSPRPLFRGLRKDRLTAGQNVTAEQTRLQGRLVAIRNRMDAAYADKLDGKIPEDFWNAR